MAAPQKGSIQAAAEWLVATTREEIAGPVVPAVCNRIGLDAVQACAAIRQANTIRIAAQMVGEVA